MSVVLWLRNLGIRARLGHQKVGVYLSDIMAMEDLKDRIARSKYIHEDELDKIDQISVDLRSAIDDLISKGGVANA